MWYTPVPTWNSNLKLNYDCVLHELMYHNPLDPGLMHFNKGKMYQCILMHTGKYSKLLTMAFKALSPPDSTPTTHTHSPSARAALLIVPKHFRLISTSGPLLMMTLPGTPSLPLHEWIFHLPYLRSNLTLSWRSVLTILSKRSSLETHHHFIPSISYIAL